jgi:hypothetical protein
VRSVVVGWWCSKGWVCVRVSNEIPFLQRRSSDFVAEGNWAQGTLLRQRRVRPLAGPAQSTDMSAAAPMNSPNAAPIATAAAPSKAAMMFMRASSKVQQDKSKDLAVSVESIKAQLSGLGFRGMLPRTSHNCGDISIRFR